jgi:hypothetical protein
MHSRAFWRIAFRASGGAVRSLWNSRATESDRLWFPSRSPISCFQCCRRSSFFSAGCGQVRKYSTKERRSIASRAQNSANSQISSEDSLGSGMNGSWLVRMECREHGLARASPKPRSTPEQAVDQTFDFHKRLVLNPIRQAKGSWSVVVQHRLRTKRNKRPTNGWRFSSEDGMARTCLESCRGKHGQNRTLCTKKLQSRTNAPQASP